MLGWVIGNDYKTAGALDSSDGEAALVLDRTCFYAEAGGQIGDAGTIRTDAGATFDVSATQRVGEAVLHVGRVTQGQIRPGDSAAMTVDAKRERTRKNHASRTC